MSCTPKSKGYSSQISRYSRSSRTSTGWCDNDVCEFHDQCASYNCSDDGFCVGNGDEEDSVMSLVLSIALTACFCFCCCALVVICIRRVK